jgi:hypothetical protein
MTRRLKKLAVAIGAAGILAVASTASLAQAVNADVDPGPRRGYRVGPYYGPYGGYYGPSATSWRYHGGPKSDYTRGGYDPGYEQSGYYSPYYR